MIDAAASTGHRTAEIPAGVVGARLHGEGLAVALSAAAVAMLPLVGFGGPSNTAPADLFLAVAIGATLLWAGTSSGQPLRFPYAIPMGLFIAGGALGALSGPVPGTGLIAIVQDIVLLAWCWSVVNISHSARNLKILLGTWVYSAIGWTVLLYVGMAAGVEQLTGQTARQGTRVSMTLGDPNFAANYLFISIMLVWATQRPRNPGLRLAVYALLVPALALTGSISGLVSVVMAVTIAGLLGIYRRSGLLPAVTVLSFLVLLGAVGAATIDPQGVQEAAARSDIAFLRDGLGRSSSETEDRALLARQSISLYPSGGPLGAGPVSTRVRLREENASYVKEAHDDYLASLIERGLLGALGIVLLVFSIGVRTLSLCTPRLTQSVRAVVVRPNAIVGAVVGTMAAGLAYELFHVRHVWTLFGLVAALYVWGRE